jgi:hypothetical protein
VRRGRVCERKERTAHAVGFHGRLWGDRDTPRVCFLSHHAMYGPEFHNFTPKVLYIRQSTLCPYA